MISYDRLIAGGDLAYYVSFDNEQVGTLQATAFVDALDASGRRLRRHPDGQRLPHRQQRDALRARAPTRSSTRTDLRILAEYETPDWSPDKAQEWVAGQISQYGDAIAGVYAANDGIASGAIAALRAANVEPLPIVTGQDAELSAIQRILTGDQYMTVYKAIKPQAELAAEVAVALLKGEEVTGAARRSRTRPRRCSTPSPSRSTTSSRPWSPTASGRSTTSARPRTSRRARRRACARPGIIEHDVADTPANRTDARARAHDARHRQALRRGEGAHRRRLLGERGRGRRPHRRQRRGQVHARQGARRAFTPRMPARSSSTASPSRSHSPADAQDLGIATVFQDLALCDNLDVVANLWLGRELVSGSTLDEVGMEERTWTLLRELAAKIPSVRVPVASLSGGQRQTVAIARSLIGEPRIIILDEPTAALGVAQTAEVLNLIERLRERGHGVILISHNMADVMAVADRVVVLRLGRNNGVYNVVDVTSETLIAAITGAVDGTGEATRRRHARAPTSRDSRRRQDHPRCRPARAGCPTAGDGDA